MLFKLVRKKPGDYKNIAYVRKKIKITFLLKMNLERWHKFDYST